MKIFAWTPEVFPFSASKKHLRSLFFGRPIHPYHGEHPTANTTSHLDSSEFWTHQRHPDFLRQSCTTFAFEKKRRLWAKTLQNLENLEGCKFRRLEASLFRKGDAVMTIFCGFLLPRSTRSSVREVVVALRSFFL